MMRKLAVTVFVLSLAALGCGSDSGNKTNPDTGVGAEAGKTTDTIAPQTDTPIADAPMGPEVALDTAKVDVSAVDTTQVLDVAQTDLPAPPLDTAKAVDGPGIDGTKPVLDGGVDSQPNSDVNSALDAGAMDAGSNG